MKKVFLILILAHFLVVVTAQEIFKTYTISQLQEDYKELRSELEKHHKGLYLFTPKKEFDAFFDSTYKALNHPMTEIEFYKILSQTLVKTKERHTGIGWRAKDTLSKLGRLVQDKTPLLPVLVGFVADKAYIYVNGSPDSTLKKGFELLKINNQTISEVKRELLSYITFDGNIQLSKLRDLGGYFMYYYYLIDQSKEFELECKNEMRQITQHTLPAISIDSLNKWLAIYYPEEVKKNKLKESIKLSFVRNSKRFAFLKIRTFDYNILKQEGVEYYKTIKSIFKTIKKNKSSHLIIDLRNNGGGKISYFLYLLNQISKAPKNTLYFQNHKPEKTIKTFSIKPKPYHFKGKVYILVNRGSFSSATMFTSLAREYADAIIIGEETAGRFDGTTAGQYKFFNLKNSKIGIKIPLQIYELNVTKGQKGRGVIPDYVVELTQEDLKFEVDTTMDFILNLMDKE